MGWFSIREAIVNGSGAYGTVHESLRGEIDPHRTLRVAIEQVEREIKGGLQLGRNAKIRLAYWARRSDYRRK